MFKTINSEICCKLVKISFSFGKLSLLKNTCKYFCIAIVCLPIPAPQCFAQNSAQTELRRTKASGHCALLRTGRGDEHFRDIIAERRAEFEMLTAEENQLPANRQHPEFRAKFQQKLREAEQIFPKLESIVSKFEALQKELDPLCTEYDALEQSLRRNSTAIGYERLRQLVEEMNQIRGQAEKLYWQGAGMGDEFPQKGWVSYHQQLDPIYREARDAVGVEWALLCQSNETVCLQLKRRQAQMSEYKVKPRTETPKIDPSAEDGTPWFNPQTGQWEIRNEKAGAQSGTNTTKVPSGINVNRYPAPTILTGGVGQTTGKGNAGQNTIDWTEWHTEITTSIISYFQKQSKGRFSGALTCTVSYTVYRDGRVIVNNITGTNVAFTNFCSKTVNSFDGNISFPQGTRRECVHKSITLSIISGPPSANVSRRKDIEYLDDPNADPCPFK